MDLRVHNARDWLFDTQFGRVAQWLDDHGYTFDYISDRQLAELPRVRSSNHDARRRQIPSGARS